jgi:hypothetical protein
VCRKDKDASSTLLMASAASSTLRNFNLASEGVILGWQTRQLAAGPAWIKHLAKWRAFNGFRHQVIPYPPQHGA